MPTASPDDLRRWRLAAQLIDRPAGGSGGSAFSPATTVRHLAAIQAQDFAAACWAVGLRTPGSTRADVLAAFDDGQVVRSWPMRGTLHFVAAEDLGWMLSVTATRTLRSALTRERGLGIDERAIGCAHDALLAELGGGRSLGRAALLQALDAAGIATAGGRGYHLLWHLAQTGLVCWGPTHGGQQSMVLVDEWVREPRRLSHDEALREFALRYFAGHGPATLADLAWWSKMTVADAKRGLAAAGDAVASVAVDDTEYWMPAHLPDAVPQQSGAALRRRHTVYALPGYDEYLLGYRDRSLVLRPEHADLIVPGGNGVFQPTIVSDGRVTGTWRRDRARGRTVGAQAQAAAHPVPFADPPAWQRAGFARAADAYARFLATPVPQG